MISKNASVVIWRVPKKRNRDVVLSLPEDDALEIKQETEATASSSSSSESSSTQQSSAKQPNQDKNNSQQNKNKPHQHQSRRPPPANYTCHACRMLTYTYISYLSTLSLSFFPSP